MFRRMFFLAALALILNQLLPFFSPSVASGDSILVCTLDGPKLIKFDGSGNTPPGNSGKIKHCPLCTLNNSQKDKLVLPAMFVATPKLSTEIAYIDSIWHKPSDLNFNTTHPRAPPTIL